LMMAQTQQVYGIALILYLLISKRVSKLSTMTTIFHR
jgi:hypothetical protein